MELSFHKSERVTPDPPEPTEIIRTFIVSKLQRSKTGFKTPTQTIRPCRWCVKRDHRPRGAQPFPVATWLLTAREKHPRWNEDPRVETLALCSDHFKELKSDQAGSEKPITFAELMGMGSTIEDIVGDLVTSADPSEE